MLITYPKPIVIEAGRTIQVGLGCFLEPDYLLATFIVVGETGVMYQLDPDEHRAAITPEVQGKAARFASILRCQLPLVAQVVTCRQYGTNTLLEVHPLNQPVVEYDRLMESASRLAVPAFWESNDLRREWEDLHIPSGHAVRRLRDARPSRNTEDAIELRRTVAFLFNEKPVVDLPQFCEATGRCEDKLANAQRHVNRLKAIYELRHALYEAPESPGREFLLGETREEVSVTVEALATTAFSVLDILARAIDRLYVVTVTPSQRVSKVSFLRLLEGLERGDPSAAPRPSLKNKYPDEPLTAFLTDQREGWVRTLEALRHALVHETTLDVGEVVGGGVLVGLRPEVTLEDPFGFEFQDALKLATDWLASLNATVYTSFAFMRRFAEDLRAGDTSARPVYPARINEEYYSPHLVPLHEALDAWIAVPVEGHDAVVRFYSRMDPQWQKEWSIQRCGEFLKTHPLKSFGVTIGGGGTDPNYGQIATVLVKMEFESHSDHWWFSLISTRPRRWGLVRTPLSTFPSDRARASVTGLTRRQSGPESGHRDVLVNGVVANTSDEMLAEVEVAILHGRAPAPQQIMVTGAVGELAPGTTYDFELTMENGCLPPFNAALLHEPLYCRVIYRTLRGDTVREDSPFPGN